MNGLRIKWLGEVLVEVEYFTKTHYAGSRWEPADREHFILGMFVNGRAVNVEKYHKLVDYVMENGR